MVAYLLVYQVCIIRTRRFAPRAAYATRYACSGRKNSVKRKKKSPCLIVSANWRLENAKSPAAMLQENNPQTPHALYLAFHACLTCFSCVLACVVYLRSTRTYYVLLYAPAAVDNMVLLLYCGWLCCYYCCHCARRN